jgi:hypothetical protein
MEDTQKKINQLMRNCTKTDLIKQCKEKHLGVSGTKIDLIHRILNINDNTNLKKINEEISTIPNTIKIVKNKYNNYCHNETKFVFDNITKRVIGVQLENGNIRCLKKDDIDTCKLYKFRYNIPETLEQVYEILENSDSESSSKSDELDEEDSSLEEDNEDDINEI